MFVKESSLYSRGVGAYFFTKMAESNVGLKDMASSWSKMMEGYKRMDMKKTGEDQ